MNRWLALIGVLSLLFLAPSKALCGDYSIDVRAWDKACRGTTLFAETIDPAHPRIVEVDMDGNTVWEYAIPREIVRGGRPGQAMDVEWIPATDTILFVMPFKGIYEVNRKKEIVWRHLTKTVSHDADRLPGGNTLYTFAWENKGAPEVTEITPDGTVVWQWIATEHIAPDQRRHRGTVERDGFAHVNGAIRLDNGLTRISLRNFFTTVEVDERGDVAWSLSTMGNGRRIRYVHDPRSLPDGNMILSTHGPQVLFILTPRRSDRAQAQAKRHPPGPRPPGPAQRQHPGHGRGQDHGADPGPETGCLAALQARRGHRRAGGRRPRGDAKKNARDAPGRWTRAKTAFTRPGGFPRINPDEKNTPDKAARGDGRQVRISYPAAPIRVTGIPLDAP